MRFPAFLYFLLLPGIAKAGDYIAVSSTGSSSDQNVINEALKDVSDGTVYLNAGVYEITGPLYIHSDTTLTGSSDAIIRVSSSSSQWFVKGTGIINHKDYPLKNVEISGFQIDGNLENLPSSYANYGSGDHNAERLIYLRGSKKAFMENISIHDMQLYNAYSDGIQIAYCNGAYCYNNFISNCEHEGIFYVNNIGGTIQSNKIAGITSDATRLDNCVNITIHDNVFYSYNGSDTNGQGLHGENGLQIADEGYSHGGGSEKPNHTTNIEVFNNTFANNGLRAIWLDSTGKGYDNVYIHDNTFIDVPAITVNGTSVNDISYSNPPSKEMSETVFSAIEEILGFKFFDTGVTSQSALIPNESWQSSGVISAWVDIIGWNNETELDGLYYVPAGEQPIVKYGVKNEASRPVSTSSELTISHDQNNSTADLKVTAVYEVQKNVTKRVNGAWKSEKSYVQKTQVSHFYDTEKSPKEYISPSNLTADVLLLNGTVPQVRVMVPADPGVFKVRFECNSSTIEHYQYTATHNKTSKGLIYTEISPLDYWIGNNSRLGQWVIFPGYISAADIEKSVNITAYDFYGKEYKIQNFDIEQINYDHKVPTFWYLVFGVLGIFGAGTWRIWRCFL